MSVKGKKTSEELLLELFSLIETAEAAEEREIATMLAEGTKVRHKLQDDDTNIDVWYNGEVRNIDGDRVSIEYEGYEDCFEWERAAPIEDIKNKDLIQVI